MARSIAQQTETALREQRVFDLRRAGLTYEQIGQQLGITSVGAWKALGRYIKSRPAETMTESTALECERYDAWLRRLERVASKRHLAHSGGRLITVTNEDGVETPVEDDGPVISAILAARQISADRRKLLGMDAAQKFEVRTVDELDARLIELAEQVAGNDSGTAPGVPAAADSRGEGAAAGDPGRRRSGGKAAPVG